MEAEPDAQQKGVEARSEQRKRITQRILPHLLIGESPVNLVEMIIGSQQKIFLVKMLRNVSSRSRQGL